MTAYRNYNGGNWPLQRTASSQTRKSSRYDEEKGSHGAPWPMEKRMARTGEMLERRKEAEAPQ